MTRGENREERDDNQEENGRHNPLLSAVYISMFHKTLLFLFMSFCLPASAELLKVPGGEFDISWHSAFNTDEKRVLRLWLQHAAESASLINGDFPRSQTTIVMQRANRGKGPVPWANTIRHTQPQGVSFHVRPGTGLDAMKADWTATHEFSHLYLPYPGRSDIWISEGFASYYQNIFMMRMGTLSEAQGWQKIVNGLKRGEADPNQSITLERVSREMRQRRAFKRVYWSGALYFLQADLALRQQGKSLDEVVSTFRTCCRDSQQDWNGASIVKALDSAAKTHLFLPLYREYQQTTQLPDYHHLLAKVGVTIVDQQVVLSPIGDPRTLLRKSMSSPP